MLKNENDENVNKSIEVSAKTLEEAIEYGLGELGLTREEVEIEVIKEGKRGVFGLGAEDAQVRLTLKDVGQPLAEVPVGVERIEPGTDEPAPPTEVEEQAATPEEADEEVTAVIGDAPLNDKALADSSDVEEFAVEFLNGLLDRMGIDADVIPRVADDLVEPGEDPPLVLDITGADLGILIGRRSETLRALQYMVRLMVSKQLNRWHPVVVDVESYRVRRRNSLHQLAQKMAERAVSSGRQVVMESMPAYERRIIHIALKNDPTVMTKSVGSDDNRKVTIIPK